ncbi:hypothetical protein [Streptomyces calvus]|jgi:hypothetical protein|uniref:hypothetical protein n=1 Tax=Streptomyces calvus TaxID=67282 RepID=UPI00371303ED
MAGNRLQRAATGRLREWWRERRSWELSEEARANVRTVGALVTVREAVPSLTDEARTMLQGARRELEAADTVLLFDEHRRSPLGSHVTAAHLHLNAARLLWARSFVTSPQDVSPYLAGLKAVVNEHLPPGDPRRKSVERLQGISSADELVRLTEAVEAAQAVALREKLRAASFVRIVCCVAGFLMLLAAGVAVLTSVWSQAVPMCFNPSQSIGSVATAPESPVSYRVVCPIGSDDSPRSPDLDDNVKAVATWGDYVVVEVVGLVAAGVAAASALRKIRGTSTPYPVPVASALLKLPAGALTAVLGLLLMRGGFVPGLSSLDSSAQIIAWAVVFGYSQELFTKFVDRRGQMVLDAVRGPTSPPQGTATAPGPAAASDSAGV